MTEKITEFLDSKGISDNFIRNIVRGFIIEHTKLYGDVIPFESLMERLKTNLKSINLIDPDKQVTDILHPYVVGRYEGFDKNSISMFFTPEHLQNPQLREDFIGVLIHELTHCAYTIKENNLYKREKHVFGTYEKLLDGKTPLVDGNITYMEPIINYISSCIFGKKNGAYLSQTSNIEKLTRLVDEKRIVGSAFNSDEEEFRHSFDMLPDGAYEYYTEGMEWLSYTGEYSFKRGTEIMNNFFSGNIPSLTERQLQIRKLKELKGSISKIQHPSQEQRLEQVHEKSLRRHGFIDMVLLTSILGGCITIGVLVALMLLR